MPGPRSTARLSDEQDPLVRILNDMVDSALRWESEHGPEDPYVRLTERSTDIHLISTDLALTDADLELR